MDIRVEQLPPEELERRGVTAWPIWEKAASTFEWFYDEPEQCLFLEGEVEVEVPGNRRVRIQAGDFVTFPQGLKCTWVIHRDVKKHYRFG